jgi:hypothetical protein
VKEFSKEAIQSLPKSLMSDYVKVIRKTSNKHWYTFLRKLSFVMIILLPRLDIKLCQKLNIQQLRKNNWLHLDFFISCKKTHGSLLYDQRSAIAHFPRFVTFKGTSCRGIKYEVCESDSSSDPITSKKS